jgi:hypothetical protein
MANSTEQHVNESFNDSRFAQAVDALLWISPSGEPDNKANFQAVKWWLEERGQAIEKLNGVVDAVLPTGCWREHPQLAAPLLEAVLFLDWLGGDRDNLSELFLQDGRQREQPNRQGTD